MKCIGDPQSIYLLSCKRKNYAVSSRFLGYEIMSLKIRGGGGPLEPDHYPDFILALLHIMSSCTSTNHTVAPFKAGKST